MDNREFLDAVIPAGTDEFIFTCAVPGNPKEASYPFVSMCHFPHMNNFFCVSTMKLPEVGEGAPRRVAKNFHSLYVLVVDDVGTKVPEGDPMRVLGVPTYTIETSPGNFQWGYVLEEPVRDRAVAQGLVDAMCRNFTGDTAGLNRLVRLPVGMNGKPEYGEPPPPTRLASHSGTEISAAYAIEQLKAEPVDETKAESRPYLLPDIDPVVVAMDKRGVSWVLKDAGVYNITCPWIEDHSGHLDNGTAYIAPAGFKCHHGHCEKKTFRDFRKFLGISAYTMDRVIDAAALGEFTGEDARPLAPMSGEGPGAPTSGPPVFLHSPTVERFHHGGRLMTEREGKKAFPRQWIFENLVTANGMWLLAGQGGLGKSRLALAVAMSAATGLPFGEFVPTNKDGVRTLFMTQEDDDAEKFHRYRTQLIFLQKKDARWKDPKTLAKLEANLFLPEIDPTEGLSEALQIELIEYQRETGAFGLVIWDPLILFWQGEDDAGLNSAQGARDTLNLLTKVSRLPAKEQNVPYSVCFVHHLNKSGTVLGSVMVENLVRTVFKLAPDEAADRTDEMRGRLIVDKSNGVALRGRETGIKLHKPHAVVEMLGKFASLTPEDRVAMTLISGEVHWDQPLKILKSELIDTLVELGDTKTARASVVSRVLKTWGGARTDLTPLGLYRLDLPKGEFRFQPLERRS
jgi:hypothetical protein